jgi:hypothetical protein
MTTIRSTAYLLTLMVSSILLVGGDNEIDKLVKTFLVVL